MGIVEDSLEQLRNADEEALRSQVAFATGRFDEYLESRAAESRARLDAINGSDNETTGS